MIEAIKYNLGNLTNLEGRDSRSTFWYYILFLVLVQFLIGLVIGTVFAGPAIADVIRASSDGASRYDMHAGMMREMSGTLAAQAWIGAFISLAVLALFVAAFVRRLHDSRNPTWIVVIPVITTLVGIYASISMIGPMAGAMASGNMDGMMEANKSFMLPSLVPWIGYLVVIFMGVLPSKETPPA